MLYKCVLYNWTRFGHLVNFGSEKVETKHVAGKICFGPLDSQIKGRPKLLSTIKSILIDLIGSAVRHVTSEDNFCLFV